MNSTIKVTSVRNTTAEYGTMPWHRLWSLIRRIQRPKRMADFLTKRPKRIGESIWIANRNALLLGRDDETATLVSALVISRFDYGNVVVMACHGITTIVHCAPHLWNSLPADTRNAAMLHTFKKKLKTFMFHKHFFRIGILLIFYPLFLLVHRWSVLAVSFIVGLYYYYFYHEHTCCVCVHTVCNLRY